MATEESTTKTPLPQDQTRELLEFIRTESSANRAAVREDAESNRKLLLDTVKIISIPMSLVIVLFTFLGIKSMGDIKETIQTEARRETQSEITRLQKEIRQSLEEQFQTPNLQKLVKEAARESTEKSAEPLIKSEVATQVKARVDAEKPAIASAVTKQSQEAVKQMAPQIGTLVKQSVDEKVARDITPVLQKVNDEEDLQLLILRLNADDADAYDTLKALGPRLSHSDLVLGALRTVYAAHTSGFFVSRQFNTPMTDEQLVQNLSNADSFYREAAVDTLAGRKNLGLLPKIVEMMRTDHSFNVRCSAYRTFNDWTANAFKCMDPDAFTWWQANSAKFGVR